MAPAPRAGFSITQQRLSELELFQPKLKSRCIAPELSNDAARPIDISQPMAQKPITIQASCAPKSACGPGLRVRCDWACHAPRDDL